MTQSRDVRIECALAMQYSDAWILTHIGGTVADITRAIERMDAADRGDNAAWRAALSDEARRGVSEVEV